MTYGNAPRTQAEWDAKRAEVKAEAADTIKANAEEARDNLAALRAEAGYPEPVARNEVGEVEAAEAAVDALAEEQEAEREGDISEEEAAERKRLADNAALEEVKPYGEWTNEELSEELKARELPHSGNKDELVARLEESDKADNDE
ncbi:hypothetical protein SEA_JEMERALD_9 [Microbacterium phage Jemerald]|nr:hypothetical protein SEA_JUICER_9 [Microbacterium phage Juicer]WNO27248.1 hypothetical protein SEA_JEMERALD_9 [Microbacterium phage Jemerald]